MPPSAWAACLRIDDRGNGCEPEHRREDGGEGTLLARQFQATSLPTFLILNGDKQLAGIIHGYQPADNFVKLLDEETKKYQDFLWSTPMLGWIGLLIAWKLFDFVFDPVFTAAVNLIYPGVRYG